MCCACGRIRRAATKNSIRNYCCTLIAWIIRRKCLYLPPLRRPWLELAGISHHSLDIVTPSAALFAIEDHIGYRNFRHRRLTGSLKGNRPDQVVSIFNRLTPSDGIPRHCLIWFRLGPGGRCCELLCTPFVGSNAALIASLHPCRPMSQRGEVARCSRVAVRSSAICRFTIRGSLLAVQASHIRTWL